MKGFMSLLLAILNFTIPAALNAADSVGQLPTGVKLDPAVSSLDVGSFPLAMVSAPAGKYVAILLNGWREQGVQIVDLESRAVVQTISQPAAFIGIAFSPDGKTLWTSGGFDDVVHRYRWADGRATLDKTMSLDDDEKKGTSYPAGIAFSPDGNLLLVAENLGDTLAVVDTGSGKILQRLQTDRYPYGVAVSGDGHVFVSAWGDRVIDEFQIGTDRWLQRVGRIDAVRHPSALLLNGDGSRLFVTSSSTDRIAVIDTKRAAVVSVLADRAPYGPAEGSTPNALALSSDEKTLYVAEADNNAVAVFALEKNQSQRLIGRIPTDWYPTGVAVSGNNLLVLSGKGKGTAPNPGLPQPGKRTPPASGDYTLGQIRGSLAVLPTGNARVQLEGWSKRVTAANRWNQPSVSSGLPPFKHVIYVIKENRTYDQILGDMAEGDGDASLVFFPRDVTPNHHALAGRFGLFDRFFVNAEVSADGHNWSTAAYATEYLEKTVPSAYSSRGRGYDFEGSNRDRVVDENDDVNAPAEGYLWNKALARHVTMRNYGEFVTPEKIEGSESYEWLATRHALDAVTSREYPGYDLSIPDQKRMDVWMSEFEHYVRDGNLPQLEIMRLPNDHTSGGSAGKPTPRAYMADNDVALGRLVAAVSHSQYWKDTIIFVLEDDAQNGPDHVDSHRSVMLAISAWNRGGVNHRFVNTSDVVATMEKILGLDSMSQFDHFGRPLTAIFAERPNLKPYDVLTSSVDLQEKNPENTPAAKGSARLDLSQEDRADEDAFNRILWAMIKGAAPYPGISRAPAQVLEGRN
ncbi:MAG: beta-propeller fold lactonase family protein [Acidobacteriota bacterium]